MKKLAAIAISLVLLAFTGCGATEKNYSDEAGHHAPAFTNEDGETSSQNEDEEEIIPQNENEKSDETAEETKKSSDKTEKPVKETKEKDDSKADETVDYTPTKAQNSGGKRCVAYYTSWSAYARNVSVADIDASKLTHINFAFANLKGDGEICVGDSWVDVEKPFGSDTWEGEADSRGHFNQLKLLKQKYPHVKTLISVGGWTWSNNFSEAASTDASRKKFAESALTFITKYGFDGLDIDWEYPVEGGNNIPHKPEDKENYTKLLKCVREAFDAQGKKDNKHYLLTIAGGANVTFVQNTEPKKMMQYLDYINVMTYDYHGGFDAGTGINAPMYAEKGDNFSIDESISAYLKAGVKPEDLNLGLAFYGRGWGDVSSTKNNGLHQPAKAQTGVGFGMGTWEGGCYDFWDLQENYIGKSGYKRYWDKKSQTPYLFNGTNFITYDDEESIKIKLEYADKKKLGGVMYWEFSGDKNMTLQNVVVDFYGIFGKAVSGTTQKPSAGGGSSENSSSGGASEWKKDATYNGSEIVTYGGKKYQAKWWTQGEVPGNGADGAWKLVS
ncbi:MAG: glycosyl hydrolase family 18 protein [Oscillospiraceae bacterium]